MADEYDDNEIDQSADEQPSGLRKKLAEAIAYLPIPLEEFQQEGDGKYFSRLTQLGYAGEKLHKAQTVVYEIARAIESRHERLQRGSSDYFEHNTTFVPKEVTDPLECECEAAA